MNEFQAETQNAERARKATEERESVRRDEVVIIALIVVFDTKSPLP